MAEQLTEMQRATLWDELQDNYLGISIDMPQPLTERLFNNTISFLCGAPEDDVATRVVREANANAKAGYFVVTMGGRQIIRLTIKLLKTHHRHQLDEKRVDSLLEAMEILSKRPAGM